MLGIHIIIFTSHLDVLRHLLFPCHEGNGEDELTLTR